MFTIWEDQLEKWGLPPKVDLTIAKLSKPTVILTEESCSVQDHLDRADMSLKRGYISAAAQCSWEVAMSSKDWILQIQFDMDFRIPQDDILDPVRRDNLASEFLCD